MLFPNSVVMRRLRLGRVVGLAALILGMATAHAKEVKELKVGDTFPDIAAAGLEGTVPDTKGKVVLVDFWASWCGPCKKSFPVLTEMHKKYADKGFTVVAVSLDEDKTDMDKFLKKNPVPFPVVRDSEGKKLAEKIDVQGIPMSFLIGVDGKVIAIHEGFEGEKTRKAYMTEIEQALKR